jgi:hypothetical protein
MTGKPIGHYGALLALLALAGCTHAPYENPYTAVAYNSDHVRLAVMPRYRSIAVLPFENQSEFVNAPTYARRSFYGNLAAYKNYQLQTLAQTDALLKSVPRKLIDISGAKELGPVLKTDLLAFGRVQEQRVSYGLIYTTTKVAVEVALVDARTGEVVWRADDARKHSVGGIDPYAMSVAYERHYMWAREVIDRYDELFRDMMMILPDRSVQ